MWKILDFLNANHGVAVIISSLSTFVAAVAAGIALYYNAKTQRQYKKSQEPQLTMRIDNFDGLLYLLTENTGKTVAKGIKLNVLAIEENGEQPLRLDKLFSQTFDLYPCESVQAMIALSGENMSTGSLYPTITLNISYEIPFQKRRVDYLRTVTFSKVYDNKVCADINVDLGRIEDLMYTAANSILRTANYLDGHQLAMIDRVNILTGKSFHNDLCDAIDTGRKVPVKSRSQTIHDSTSNQSADG